MCLSLHCSALLSLAVVLTSDSGHVAKTKPKFLCFHMLQLLLDAILGSIQSTT